MFLLKQNYTTFPLPSLPPGPPRYPRSNSKSRGFAACLEMLGIESGQHECLVSALPLGSIPTRDEPIKGAKMGSHGQLRGLEHWLLDYQHTTAHSHG